MLYYNLKLPFLNIILTNWDKINIIMPPLVLSRDSSEHVVTFQWPMLLSSNFLKSYVAIDNHRPLHIAVVNKHDIDVNMTEIFIIAWIYWSLRFVVWYHNCLDRNCIELIAAPISFDLLRADWVNCEFGKLYLQVIDYCKPLTQRHLCN